MNRLTFPAVVAAVALAPILTAAETLSPAAQATKDQLAAEIGVASDDFTLMQLNQLKCRLDASDNDAQRARIIREIRDYGLLPPEAAPGSKDQLAGTLGIEASDYTTQELVYLHSIMESDDCTLEEAQRHLAANESIGLNATRAKVQLARSLGVEASDYTLRELVTLRIGDDDDDG